jgi:hypothetical protein
MARVRFCPTARALRTAAIVAGLGAVWVPRSVRAQSATERTPVVAGVPDSTRERSRARVFVDADGRSVLRVVVPSYLAVFELIPNQGIAQIFPTRAADAAVPIAAGNFPLDEGQAAVARVVSLAAAARAGTANGNRGLAPVRHVVVLAANEPLRVGDPTDIATVMKAEIPGLRTPRRWSPEESDLVALVARVRPVSAGAAVTVELISLPMPEAAPRLATATAQASSANAGDVVMVSCFGGVVSVSRDVARTGVPFCGRDDDAVRGMRSRLLTPPVDPGAGRPVAPAPAPVSPTP